MRISPAVRNILAALSLVVAGGCAADPVGPTSEFNGIQAGKVTVAIATDGLSLSNQTERAVYFVAFESDLAALIDWIPCTGGAGCNALLPGGQRTYAWANVPGYSPAKARYLVYWWNAEVQADGTVRATNMQSMAVTR